MTQVTVMTMMIMAMVTMATMETIHNHLISFRADTNIRDNTEDNNQEESPLPSSGCQGAADCFTGMVTDIVDRRYA